MHKVDKSELVIRFKLVKRCEYCDEAKPIRIWVPDKDVLGSKDEYGPGYYHLIMFEVANLQKGKLTWTCNECLSYIKQDAKFKIIKYDPPIPTLDPPV